MRKALQAVVVTLCLFPGLAMASDGPSAAPASVSDFVASLAPGEEVMAAGEPSFCWNMYLWSQAQCECGLSYFRCWEAYLEWEYECNPC